MKRREFIRFLGGAAVGWPVAAKAQQPAKIARIGWLGQHLARNPKGREFFRQGLRDLGYVEGRNFVIEFRDAEGKFDRYPALAAELVALKVDVILAPNTGAALAAKQATTTIPIVFGGVSDAVGFGLVTSLARPGGNLTGLSNLDAHLVGKRLELLMQAIPGVRLVAVLWEPGPAKKIGHEGAEVAARALGVRLQFVEARGLEDFDRAFSDMTSAGVGALIALPGGLFIDERRRLVDLAAKHRLPALHCWRGFVDVGGLMAYGPHGDDVLRRAATYVDKILKGAKPADLPVEQHTKFEQTANAFTDDHRTVSYRPQ